MIVSPLTKFVSSTIHQRHLWDVGFRTIIDQHQWKDIESNTSNGWFQHVLSHGSKHHHLGTCWCTGTSLENRHILTQLRRPPRSALPRPGPLAVARVGSFVLRGRRRLGHPSARSLGSVGIVPIDWFPDSTYVETVMLTLMFIDVNIDVNIDVFAGVTPAPHPVPKSLKIAIGSAGCD